MIIEISNNNMIIEIHKGNCFVNIFNISSIRIQVKFLAYTVKYVRFPKLAAIDVLYLHI